MTSRWRVRSQTQLCRSVRRGSSRELADALAASGVAARMSGPWVRAWLHGHEHIAVIMRPGWRGAVGGCSWRRVWSWRFRNDTGWRLRADTAEVARGVAVLLLRSVECDGDVHADGRGGT